MDKDFEKKLINIASAFVVGVILVVIVALAAVFIKWLWGLV